MSDGALWVMTTRGMGRRGYGRSVHRARRKAGLPTRRMWGKQRPYWGTWAHIDLELTDDNVATMAIPFWPLPKAEAVIQ